MAIECVLEKVRIALRAIEASGFSFGKIELIVRDGEVKHVNVSYEVKNTRTGEEQARTKGGI